MKRRIHVDQGRRATNLVYTQDNDIVRVDDDQGNALMWGGTVKLFCRCGCHVASVVQPKSDQAHIAIAKDTDLVAFTSDRRSDI